MIKFVFNQDALKTALSSGLDFKGTYYYESTHKPAINPILCLKDVGRIGLPLSEPAAKRIIAHCRQAPFGQGERTIVDPTVRDTWEMDAADVSLRSPCVFLLLTAISGLPSCSLQVRFDNPEWPSFVDGVVRNACAALGVNHAASRPRCELYKMLLYEKGSQ